MKNTKIAAVIAAAGSALLCGMNWLLASFDMNLGITGWGGEYKACLGLGIAVETFYGETAVGDPGSAHTQIGFDPVSFAVTLLILFVVSMLILRKKSK